VHRAVVCCTSHASARLAGLVDRRRDGVAPATNRTHELRISHPIVTGPASLAIGVANHSLHYNIGESTIYDAFPGWLREASYLIVVSTPLFVSSLHEMIHCGVAVILSAAVTKVFFDHAVVSVWCFFAAVLSLYLCVLFATLPGDRSGARG
jgi:hypothetical protein